MAVSTPTEGSTDAVEDELRAGLRAATKLAEIGADGAGEALRLAYEALRAHRETKAGNVVSLGAASKKWQGSK